MLMLSEFRHNPGAYFVFLCRPPAGRLPIGGSMSLKGYFTWFQENWQKAGVAVGLFLAIYLVVLVLPHNTLWFALLMFTPLYNLHETEEYIFPGGFAQFFNQNILKTDPQTGPLNIPAVFWINMAYVWIALPLFSLLAIVDLRWGAWMPYFFIFQALAHLILGIVGKRLLNPGMLSGWLVIVPWGAWTIWLLVQSKTITNPYWNVYLLIGLLVNLSLPVVGRFLLVNYRRRQTA